MPSNFRPGTAILTLMIAASLSGCVTNPTLRDSLPVLGGIFGGIGCYKLFPGKNQDVATALCALGGTVLGATMREVLSDAEKPKMVEATYNTLETRKPQTVQLEGKTIKTEIVPPAPPPTPSRTAAKPAPSPTAPASPVVATAGKTCSTVRQTVTTNAKEQYVEDVTACKENGKWVVA